MHARVHPAETNPSLTSALTIAGIFFHPCISFSLWGRGCVLSRNAEKKQKSVFFCFPRGTYGRIFSRQRPLNICTDRSQGSLLTSVLLFLKS